MEARGRMLNIRNYTANYRRALSVFFFFLWFRTFTSIAWWMDVRVFPATPHHPPLIEQQKQARLQDTHTHTQKTEAKQNQKEGGGSKLYQLTTNN